MKEYDIIIIALKTVLLSNSMKKLLAKMLVAFLFCLSMDGRSKMACKSFSFAGTYKTINRETKRKQRAKMDEENRPAKIYPLPFHFLCHKG